MLKHVTAPIDDGPPPQDDGTPAELQGLIDFLNSRATARRPERFDHPASAAAFLSRCALDYDGRPLTAADTARLKVLRDALVHAVEEPANSEAWAVINDATATAPMRVQTAVGPTIALQAQSRHPADAVIASVLNQLTNAAITGRWQRLGACARCRRVFYDNTRSHTRRWCSYANCGNRANVAAYRSRTKKRR
jgi:predicted RNA-binding Zn ribbon-like protein